MYTDYIINLVVYLWLKLSREKLDTLWMLKGVLLFNNLHKKSYSQNFCLDAFFHHKGDTEVFSAVFCYVSKQLTIVATNDWFFVRFTQMVFLQNG